MTDEQRGFDDVKARLDEIAEEVKAEGISLDDALALYEEAVKLGIEACDLSEQGLLDARAQGEEVLAELESIRAQDAPEEPVEAIVEVQEAPATEDEGSEPEEG